MSEIINLKIQSLSALHLLINYCRSNDIFVSEYIYINKLDSTWYENNKHYFRFDSLSEEETKEREEVMQIVKNLFTL